MTERVSVRVARRLALARAGLLASHRGDLPGRAGRGDAACLAHIARPGYLQLDTVSVAGARSHSLVLLSRVEGLDPERPEALLRPGSPLFEYWGHEASWMPLSLYPAFGFRRTGFRSRPWWQRAVGAHPQEAEALLHRIEREGPLKSADLEGRSDGGWWNWKLSKKLAQALWSSGELAVRRRSRFQRTWDLTERVIPEAVRGRDLSFPDSLRVLLLRALEGHGWAEESTLRSTWRLRRCTAEVQAALEGLAEDGLVTRCVLAHPGGDRAGWIRCADLELTDGLERARPRGDKGVLLSPFDPVLWDRDRAHKLFGFEVLLEIFKPAAQRRWGYFCLPVLAGDGFVGRVDLKAHRRLGRLQVLAWHPEPGVGPRADRAGRAALERLAASLGLTPDPLDSGRVGV